VELLEARPGKRIVAVSHEVVIRALVADAHGSSGERLWRFPLGPGWMTGVRLAEGRLVPAMPSDEVEA